MLRTLGHSLLLASLLLTACGGDSNDTSTTTAPTITTQPSSITVESGESASFSVVASGSGLRYQWSFDGSAITGATTASLTLDGVDDADAGDYVVVVSNDAGSVTSDTATLTLSDDEDGNGTGSSGDCSTGSYAENVACATQAFTATLSTAQLAEAEYDSDEYSSSELNIYRTLWSNLPGVTRGGIAFGDLTSSAQQAAFLAVAGAALTDAGYQDFLGVLAADDYLGDRQNGYGREYYDLAIIGTPTASGDWSLQIGGHHLAFNIAFHGGWAYPTPHHIGVEPKSEFTRDGETWQVLADKASAMVAVFTGDAASLTADERSDARLSQTYTDVLIGPVEYNSGSYAAVSAKFPTSNRGLSVASLSSEQQALVIEAIRQYVADYDDSITDDLMAAYGSDSALADTYVAWSGSSSIDAPDVDVSNTYMRIDGPRVWIEIACQSGVVIQGQTHYHTMFRDKVYDYYDELGG